ncbi:hypothetical protein Tco_1159231, partial [Tanacetum coccineum]
DKPLSFTKDEFISAIGLPICKDDVPLPPKETIRARLTCLISFKMRRRTGKRIFATQVAKLSEEPEQSLIPPFREVNVDDTADKSLSKAFMQPVTQLKAPTDLKTKKKRIPHSSKLKSPYKVRVILQKKQVAETQHAEVLNQNVEEEVKDDRFVAMEQVTFEKIMDEVDSKTQDAQENVESPYDTKSEIKIIKSYQATTISDAKEGDAYESLYGLRSMPDDDLASMTGFEIQDSADHSLRKAPISPLNQGIPRGLKEAQEMMIFCTGSTLITSTNVSHQRIASLAIRVTSKGSNGS